MLSIHLMQMAQSMRHTWRDNSEMASVAATYISGPLKVVGGVQWRDTGISKN